jgi:hypothetical protein
VNECGESNPVSQKVNISLGLTDGVNNSMIANNNVIDKSETNKNMVLMPNPVTTTAILSFYAEKSYAYNIKITDIKGRVLSTKNGSPARQPTW